MKRLNAPILLLAASSLALFPVAHAQAQIEEPEFEEPEIEEPEIEEPEIEEPEIEEPEIEEPEIEEPEVEEPELEDPETEDLEGAFEPSEIDENGRESDDEAEFELSGSDDANEQQSASASVFGPTSDVIEAAEWMADLAQSQNPEFDDNGFPVRRGEIVALDLSDPARTTLIENGFRLLEITDLQSLDMQLTRLEVPEGQQAGLALDRARVLDPAGIYDFGHYYGMPYSVAGEASSGANRNSDARAEVHSQNLRLGLIDTSVQVTPLLSQVAIERHNFGTRQRSLAAEHGTAVASILAGLGASELVVASVFESDDRGHFTSAETISRAIGWLIDQDVAVINISLTGPSNSILDSVIRRAISRGAVIVAAAGNGGPAAPPAYPAALRDVVAVTAVDSNHRIYRYANHGDYIRLAAHGVRVPVSFDENAMNYFTGTSFAAPRIAARIAACVSEGVASSTCIHDLERSALDLGRPGRDDVYGFGYVE